MQTSVRISWMATKFSSKTEHHIQGKKRKFEEEKAEQDEGSTLLEQHTLTITNLLENDLLLSDSDVDEKIDEIQTRQPKIQKREECKVDNNYLQENKMINKRIQNTHKLPKKELQTVENLPKENNYRQEDTWTEDWLQNMDRILQMKLLAENKLIERNAERKCSQEETWTEEWLQKRDGILQAELWAKEKLPEQNIRRQYIPEDTWTEEWLQNRDLILQTELRK